MPTMIYCWRTFCLGDFYDFVQGWFASLLELLLTHSFFHAIALLHLKKPLLGHVLETLLCEFAFVFLFKCGFIFCVNEFLP